MVGEVILRPTLNQLAYRLAVGENRNGPPAEIVELVAGIDPQMAIHRGQQVLRRERALLWEFSLGVRRADDLPHP